MRSCRVFIDDLLQDVEESFYLCRQMIVPQDVLATGLPQASPQFAIPKQA